MLRDLPRSQVESTLFIRSFALLVIRRKGRGYKHYSTSWGRDQTTVLLNQLGTIENFIDLFFWCINTYISNLNLSFMSVCLCKQVESPSLCLIKEVENSDKQQINTGESVPVNEFEMHSDKGDDDGEDGDDKWKYLVIAN